MQETVKKYMKELILGALAVVVVVLFFQVFRNQQRLAQELATCGVRAKFAAAEGASCDTASKQNQSWAAVQDLARDTVVQVVSQTAETNILQPYRTPKQGMGMGSAFFINEEGELVTNAHVVDEAQVLWIKIPALGRMIIDVELIGRAPERDLALLKVTPEGLAKIKDKLGKIPYLKLGNSDVVHRVDEVLTLGYPLAQNSLKSTCGIVSGREHIGGRLLIQIDSPINPGNSGGPALNLAGEVIGITCSGIPSAQNVGYLIPINELKMILDELRTTALLRRPFLGIFLNNGSEELALHLGNPVPAGCYVVDVYEKSLLARHGIKAGDMIYEINGIPVDEFGDLTVDWSEDKVSLMDYIAMLELGKTVTLVFYRNGVRKEVSFPFSRTELPPVRQLFMGYDTIDYEIFGGMLLQPLMLNHLPALVANAPTLTRYAVPKNQKDTVLIVTHVVPNSQVQRLSLLAEGAIISEINGVEVRTMEDLRHAIGQNINKERMTFKTEDGVFFVLNTQKVLEDEQKLSQTYQYPLSPFIKQMLEKGLKPKEGMNVAEQKGKA